MALGALFCVAFLAGPVHAQGTAAADPVNGWSLPKPARSHAVRVDLVAEGLAHPWGMVFTAPNRILVTERPGRLRVIERGQLQPQPLAGLPPIRERGQGGLLAIALHPDYAQSRLLYLAHAAPAAGGVRLTVTRLRDEGDRLAEPLVIHEGAVSDVGRHFGTRIVFPGDGTLVFGVGDRGTESRAQDPLDPSGKMLRYRLDGGVAKDNPFLGRPGILPEIYALGVRNPQGLALQPGSGAIFEAEFGPRGGDEINLILPGRNYGWARVSWGVPYFGPRQDEGTHAPGVTQPMVYFVPSINPSGITFYRGDAFPAWKGDIIMASLAGGIVRLDVEGLGERARIVAMERLLEDELPRVRDVIEGPDGFLYTLLDDGAPDGAVHRIQPR